MPDFLVFPDDMIRYKITRNAKKATTATPELLYISTDPFPFGNIDGITRKIFIKVFIPLVIKTIQNYSGMYKGFIRIIFEV